MHNKYNVVHIECVVNNVLLANNSDGNNKLISPTHVHANELGLPTN